MAAELVKKGFDIVSGGTDSHLMVVDLRKAEITGKDAEIALDQVGITVNKNTIPFDPQPPRICSGIRLGTPALTTRGMTTAEMKIIAGMFYDAVINRADDKKLKSIKDDIRSLSKRFPLYSYKLV